MKWLQQFKAVIDSQPFVTDAELYRAFPELQYKPERMDAALLFWHLGIVAPEFTEPKKTLWQRFKALWRTGQTI